MRALSKLVLIALAFFASTLLRAGSPVDFEIGGGYQIGSGARDSEVILIRVDFIHYANENRPVAPVYYVPRISGEFPVYDLTGKGEVSWMNLEFAPVGVKLEEWDTMINGEAGFVQVTKQYFVDEKTAVRVSALHGAAKLALPFWRERGAHDFFVQLMLDAIGYKMVTHLSTPNWFSGVRIGALGAEAGATIFPAGKFAVRALVGADADLNLDFHGNVQSDSEAYTMIRADASWGHLYAKAAFVRASDGATGAAAVSGKEVLVGVRLAF
jgi:hypothetical protein